VRDPANLKQSDVPDKVTDEMKIYVDLVKRDLDEEFKVAERLDAKARGYLTTATVSVAAVQAVTVAFIAVADRAVGIGAAILAVAVLAFTGSTIKGVLTATRTHRMDGVDIKYARALMPHAYHGDPVAISNYVEMLLRVLEGRRKANEDRAKDVKEALGAAQSSAVAVAIQVCLMVIGLAIAS